MKPYKDSDKLCPFPNKEDVIDVEEVIFGW